MLRDLSDFDSQAAVWIEPMNRPVLDSALAADFDRWISQDPRHVESYARMARLWQSGALDTALEAGVPRNDNEADGKCAADEPWAGLGLATTARTLRMAATAFAMVLVVSIGLFLAQGAFAPATAYSAARGEDRKIDLADGTRLHLSGGTELSVRLTPWSREVMMARGEAYFDVAHERMRSFVVDTGSASVTVLGTAFDINLRNNGEREVRVYRGLVKVAAGNGSWQVPAGEGVALAGTRVRSLGDVAGTQPGWLDGWFEAQDTSIEVLVEQANRRSERPIVLAEGGLGALLVSGRFQLDRPDEVLATLGAIHGLEWQDDGQRLVLYRP